MMPWNIAEQVLLTGQICWAVHWAPCVCPWDSARNNFSASLPCSATTQSTNPIDLKLATTTSNRRNTYSAHLWDNEALRHRELTLVDFKSEMIILERLLGASTFASSAADHRRWVCECQNGYDEDSSRVQWNRPRSEPSPGDTRPSRRTHFLIYWSESGQVFWTGTDNLRIA